MASRIWDKAGPLSADEWEQAGGTAAQAERLRRRPAALADENTAAYAQALAAVLELASDHGQSERDMAFTCAGLGSIGALAVEAGEAPADVVLPIAREAVTDAERLGFPTFKLQGTLAVLALIDGDAARAVHLARGAVAVTDHALSRADDLATLARALMAAGDNASARDALAQAEAIAPWWPRVAATRSRLQVT